MKKQASLMLLPAVLLATACQGPSTTAQTGKLQKVKSWNIYLSKIPSSSIQFDLVILDLFGTPSSTIQTLKQKGTVVICYFSSGIIRSNRPDYGRFQPQDIGNIQSNWGGYFLNIKSPQVLAIMKDRIRLARDKGCDGVDPDNPDLYQQPNTGFNITAQDQINYNRQIALTAHQFGLIVSLKNDLAQIDQLGGFYDMAINESCHYFNECNLYSRFIQSGKPVFNIEYPVYVGTNYPALCSVSKRLGLNTLFTDTTLNGTILYKCP